MSGVVYVGVWCMVCVDIWCGVGILCVSGVVCGYKMCIWCRMCGVVCMVWYIQ